MKRHNSSEPAHRELFNVQFLDHYLCNSIVLYKFGWISMGNVRNRGRKSTWKVLTPKKAENKNEKKREDSRNCQHSFDEKIAPIPAQQIPYVEGEEDNATLKQVGYRGDDILGPLLSRQYCEEFSNYVPHDANVTPQQPCKVVQSPNQSCQPIVDVTTSLQHFKRQEILHQNEKELLNAYKWTRPN